MKKKRVARKIKKARRVLKRVVRHHARCVRKKVQRSWRGMVFIGLVCFLAIEVQLGVMNLFFNQTEQTLQNNQITMAQHIKELSSSTKSGFNNIQQIAASTHSETNKLAGELALRTREAENLIDTNQKKLEEYQLELTRLKSSVIKDKAKMMREVLLPSVRVKMKDGVGGGTIIYSRPDRNGDYHTYILTAYHVIHRLIKYDYRLGEIRADVAVEVWREDLTKLDEHRAKIVAYHQTKDLALLKLYNTQPFKYTARLIPKPDIAQVNIFTRVYTVGCPLGYDPVPTYGEIAHTQRMIDGEKVWIMNAPTIFGNSGGGVFLDKTNQLIGLSSRVAAYGQFISIPVTHLGMIVPPDTIYAWLDSQMFQFIYDDSYTKKQCDLIREGVTIFLPPLRCVKNE